MEGGAPLIDRAAAHARPRDRHPLGQAKPLRSAGAAERVRPAPLPPLCTHRDRAHHSEAPPRAADVVASKAGRLALGRPPVALRLPAGAVRVPRHPRGGGGRHDVIIRRGAGDRDCRARPRLVHPSPRAQVSSSRTPSPYPAPDPAQPSGSQSTPSASRPASGRTRCCSARSPSRGTC